MKNIKLFSALVIFIFSFSNLHTANLYSVFSGDGINVWAVGSGGYVINSVNGGVSWNNAFLGTTTYYSISGINQTIWITGNAGVLQMSTNNGSSWNQQTLGANNLKSVFFINSSTGWIAGDNGTILKSVNGGLNWTAQTAPVNTNLNCIIFTDNLNGAACGNNGTVITTSNGGATWSLSPAPTTNQLLSIDKKGNTIISSGIDRTVIKSTNNGISWSKIDYKIPTRVDVNSVFMVDPNTYYSGGSDGFLRKSADQGVSFSYQVNPMLADINKIFFFNNNTGWAAGRDNNVVLRTTDGGISWLLPAGTTNFFSWQFRLATDGAGSWGSIFSLSAQNPNEMFVCANLRIYRSLDNGSSFQTLPGAQMPVLGYCSPHSFIISPRDSNIMLAAYNSFSDTTYKDTILRSTNYGATWQISYSSHSNVDSNPLTVDPNHPDTIYLASDTTILRSTNFGLTWSPTGFHYPGKICTMHVIKEHSNIILCSTTVDTNTARTYRSTDFGATWNIVFNSTWVKPGGYPEIPGITSHSVYPDKIFQAVYDGSNNGVHISTDAGLTWTRNFVDTNAWGIGIANDDPNTIFVGNDEDNTIYFSVNSGTNWIPTLSNSSFDNQSLLCFTRKVVLAQQHRAIVQLLSIYNNPIGIQPISTEVPSHFILHQNYPNPFNPETKIEFEIPNDVNGHDRSVQLIIYNSLGQEIKTLVNEPLKAGVYEVAWNAANYPSGVYFYKLGTDDFSQTKKLILLK